MEAMFDLLERPAEIADRPGARPLAVGRGRIEFRDVAFDYDPERPILRGLDLVGRAGADGGGGRAVGRRQVDDRPAAVPLLRRDRRRGADRRPGRARRDPGEPARRRSASSRRTPCSSTTRSTTTSPTAGPRRAAQEVEAAARAARIADFVARLPRGLRDHGRRARAEALGRREAAGRHRADAAEGSRRSWCSTRRPARSTPGPSATSRTACGRSAAGAASSSSRTGCRRWSRPTGSWCSRTGRVVEEGTHAALLALGGRYARMWSRQLAEAEERERRRLTRPAGVRANVTGRSAGGSVRKPRWSTLHDTSGRKRAG